MAVRSSPTSSDSQHPFTATPLDGEAQLDVGGKMGAMRHAFIAVSGSLALLPRASAASDFGVGFLVSMAMIFAVCLWPLLPPYVPPARCLKRIQASRRPRGDLLRTGVTGRPAVPIPFLVLPALHAGRDGKRHRKSGHGPLVSGESHCARGKAVAAVQDQAASSQGLVGPRKFLRTAVVRRRVLIPTTTIRTHPPRLTSTKSLCPSPISTAPSSSTATWVSR